MEDATNIGNENGGNNHIVQTSSNANINAPLYAAFTLLLKYSTFPSMIVAAPGNVLAVNKAACTFFGYNDRQLRDLNCTELFAGGKQLLKELLELPGHNLSNKTVTCLLADGMQVAAHADAVAFGEAGKKQFCITVNTGNSSHLVNIKGAVDMTCTIGDDNIVEHVSAECAGMLGLTPAELEGKSFFERLCADDLEYSRQALNELKSKKGSTINIQNRYRHKNGDLVYLDWLITRDLLEEKQYAIARNVTEGILAQQKLLHSEQRFKSLVQDGMDLIGILDGEANYTYVSPTSYPLVGLHPEEFMGRNAFEFIHPDDHEAVSGYFADLQVTRKLKIPPFRFKHKEGNWLWIETIAINLLDDPAVQGIVVNSRDVTERKLAEDVRLFEQQEKEALINSTQDLMWSVDCDLKLLAANQNFIRHIEVSGQRLIKRGDPLLMDSFPDAYLQEWRAHYNRALAGESFRVEKHSRISDDKKQLWLETSFNPIYNRGEVVGIACASRDVTARKLAAQKLIESEARLVEAQAVAQVGSWETDLKTRVVNWSKETYRIFELEPGDLALSHNDFLEYVHPADRERVNLAFEQSFVEPGQEHQLKHRIVTRSGKEKVVEERWKIVQDEKAVPKTAHGTCQDITERHLNEQQNTFQAQLLNTIGQATIATDLAGKVLFWNSAATLIYGWTAEEAIGENIMKLAPGEENVRQAEEIIRTVSRGDCWTGEVLVRHKNGVDFPALINNCPVYDDAGKLIGIIGITTDISKQKKAEKDLLTSNLRYEYATKATSDAIWDWDADAGSFYWGDRYYELFGRIDEPGLSEIDMLRNRIHPEDVEKTRQSALEAIAGTAGHWNCELRYLKADGSYAYIANKAIIIRNEAGKAARVVGAIQDITERTKRDNQLKLLESVVIHTKDAVLVTEAEPIDEPGPGIIYVNEAFTQMTGYTAAEVLGKSPRILQGPKTDREALDRLKAAMQKWEPCEITTVNYKKNGEEFWINFSVTPVANEQGWFTHWISIERDVTKQKEIEETIHSINERYFLAAEATNDIIWDWNLLTGEVIRSNEAMKRNFGFSGEEDINNAGFWTGRVHPDDSAIIQERFRTVFENPLSFYMDQDYRFKKANGEYAYIKDKGFIVRDNTGKAIRMIGAAQDISELKAHELQLERSNEELEKRARELDSSNRELEQFAYVASHDLQEPLRMISSFLTLIQEKYDPVLDERGKKYIHFAVDGALRMRMIILDLLEYSRVGRLGEVGQEVDLNTLIQEVELLLRKRIAETKAIITYKNLPVLTIDKTPMRQLFQNLLANALLYVQPGVTPQITIAATYKKTYWEFAFTDNGIGISEEYFEKIFLIFQRLHRREEFAGTGMGLAIAKKIVNHFGGKIWVKSTPGKGSNFYFTVPVKIN